MRAVSSVLIVALLATAAAADEKARKAADETFERGRSLMAEKKFAEACAMFEQSHRLDPQAGTLFNLADCEVQLGKLTSAFVHYRELARTDKNADRRAASEAEAKRLERYVPRLQIAIQARPPGLALTIDGVDSLALLDIATPLDLGAHVIVATAPGFRELRREIAIERAGQLEKVTLRLDPVDAQDAPVTTVTTQPTEPTTPADRRHRYGLYAMAGGGGLTVVGLGFGVAAYSKWNHATDCTTCSGQEKRDSAHTARILGDIATACVVVGIASAGVGYYLWRTSESSAAIVPAATSDQTGVAIVGMF